MEKTMAYKGIDIYLGASSMRTCLGDKAETLAAMRNGESGLRYSDEFAMHVGRAEVKMTDGYSRFSSFIIEQIENIFCIDKIVQMKKGNFCNTKAGCDNQTSGSRT